MEGWGLINATSRSDCQDLYANLAYKQDSCGLLCVYLLKELPEEGLFVAQPMQHLFQFLVVGGGGGEGGGVSEGGSG